MLLLTDRLGESARLQQALGTVEPCTVVALHQALDQAPDQLSPHTLVVCDVALDNLAAAELAQAALSYYRDLTDDASILCLTRDPSQLAFTRARSVGATAILSSDTHPSELAARARQLIASPHGRRAQNAVSAVAQASIHDAGAALSSLFEAAHRRGPIPVDILSRGGDAVIEAVGRARIRAWLDVVWRYDVVTYQHCLLVAGLTSAFARGLGLSIESQRLLSQAALVHDIGKAHIPHAILTKPGRLTSVEMEVMRTHATIGHALLVRQVGFEPDLLDIVRHHHEYLDGSGYPDRLRGSAITQFVRMVTICDIYAALIERRAYKAPSTTDDAFAALVALGPKLDLGLVAAFGEILRSC